MHHPTDSIIHTTVFVTPVAEHWLERDIAQLVHPMKDRSDDPSHHERTLLPQTRVMNLPQRWIGATKKTKSNESLHFHIAKSCPLLVRDWHHSISTQWAIFSFQPVPYDWCNKGRGMCYAVCGMMHTNEPLLLIGKSSPCCESRFPLPI